MKKLIVLALSMSACNTSSFQGGSNKVPAAKPNPGVTVPGTGDQQVETGVDGTVSESFALDAPRGALDLVWVVDNSGSMGDKVAKVRKNFEKFMSGIQAKTDVRVILMSAPGGDVGANVPGFPTAFMGMGGLGITLSDEAKARGDVQIPNPIGSYNPLAMAAAATCAKTETATLGSGFDQGMKICGKDFHPATNGSNSLEDQMRMAFEDPTGIEAVAGALLPHFRAGAQRAYVFVTDEDSFIFGGNDFAEAVRRADPQGAAKVFAFRGAKSTIDMSTGSPLPTANDGCMVAFAGKAYDQAHATMGGQLFDICTDDWTPHFESLSSSVAQLARNRFELKTKAFKQVVAVEVDGKALPASAFKADGGVVTVDAASIPKGAASVKVKLRTAG